MKTVVFDCETNGLLPDLTAIHCLVLKDINTGETLSCANQQGYKPIAAGLEALEKADLIIGHNVIKFDLPALTKLYPTFEIPIEKVRDTLLLTRLLWPDIGDSDTTRVRQGRLPSKLRGSHGLEAWGHRLGLHKGDYAKEMKAEGLDPWAAWHPSMQAYCELDVDVTERLWAAIQKKDPPDRAVDLEHRFAEIIAKQERHGFRFDREKAVALYSRLAAERERIDANLLKMFQPWYVYAGTLTPKRDNRKQGYTADAPFSKVKLQTFNPASRAQIADRLVKLYGWKPTVYTPSGQPQVDETTLKGLHAEPAKLLRQRFLLEKRIGQLAEGAQAWLKLERNGRIHGSVNTIGAVTGRCTHSHPNVAQVPGVRSPYGKECRDLFGADDGFVQIGADASGLELRCLAHFMARYDGGAYAKILLEGDIHTANQEAAGLPTRDMAKTFIYGFLYGAGDEKIGEIVGKGRKEGQRLRKNFLEATPALKKLRDAVQATVQTRGYLTGIDGRRLHIRSPHAALNTLLQSAGALLVKQATIILYEDLTALGLVWGREWAMLAHVHDEFQLQVRNDPALIATVMDIAVQSFRKAGQHFNWRCPLDGEARQGTNWSECH